MSAYLRSLFVAAVLALPAAPALAQSRPAPPDRAPTLEDRLNLRPDQEPAYRAYMDELARERAEAQGSRADVDRLNAMTTPQRLDYTLAQLPKREADARRSAAATRAFYQALSSDQQRVFDRLTRIPSDPRPGQRGGGARHPGVPTSPPPLSAPASEAPLPQPR